MDLLLDWRLFAGVTASALLFAGAYFLLRSTVRPSARRYRAEAEAVHDRLNQGGLTVSQIFYQLRSMSPYAFEELVMMEFANRGFRSYKPNRYSGDGGLDGLIAINSEFFFVQVKRYRKAVQRKHMLEVHAKAERAGARALFVHSGQTSGPMLDWTHQQPRFDILSGERLLRFLHGQPVKIGDLLI